MQGQQVEMSIWAPDHPGYMYLPDGRLKRTPPGKGRIRSLYRAARYFRGGIVLTVLRWRAASADTAAPLPPALDAYEAATLAPCGEPADDLTPTAVDVRSHAILTAAPPYFRAPVLAGAAA